MKMERDREKNEEMKTETRRWKNKDGDTQIEK